MVVVLMSVQVRILVAARSCCCCCYRAGQSSQLHPNENPEVHKPVLKPQTRTPKPYTAKP